MIKRKIAMTALSVLTIILELLPYGAICIFMDDGGIVFIEEFSNARKGELCHIAHQIHGNLARHGDIAALFAADKVV